MTTDTSLYVCGFQLLSGKIGESGAKTAGRGTRQLTGLGVELRGTCAGLIHQQVPVPEQPCNEIPKDGEEEGKIYFHNSNGLFPLFF